MDLQDIARNERAIPRRLIQQLFTKLPIDRAEAAINRFVDVAMPGPVAWYARHVERRLATLLPTNDALSSLEQLGESSDCWCTPKKPDPKCSVGQSLFRVSENHRARRSA